MKEETPRPRGRPRAFDRVNVLDRAVDAFWAKGYTSTSLDDLTEEMGINRPSLYGSFGNKHDLFMQSIDRYAGTIGRLPIDAFNKQPDIKHAVESFFDTVIRCVASTDRPRGCLIMSVAAERAASDPEVRARIASAFNEKVGVIAERILAAQKEGRLPPNLDADGHARMIVSIMQSLAARARIGASRQELRRLARSFLDVLFPGTN